MKLLRWRAKQKGWCLNEYGMGDVRQLLPIYPLRSELLTRLSMSRSTTRPTQTRMVFGRARSKSSIRSARSLTYSACLMCAITLPLKILLVLTVSARQLVPAEREYRVWGPKYLRECKVDGPRIFPPH